MKKMFEMIDGLLGDIATFEGLLFELSHGYLIIDFVNEIEYKTEDGVDIVSGYVIDFAPFDELQSPISYFALDEEGVKEIISSYVLE